VSDGPCTCCLWKCGHFQRDSISSINVYDLLFTTSQLANCSPHVFSIYSTVILLKASSVGLDDFFTNSQCYSSGLFDSSSSHQPVLSSQLCFYVRCDVVWILGAYSNGSFTVETVKQSKGHLVKIFKLLLCVFCRLKIYTFIGRDLLQKQRMLIRSDFAVQGRPGIVC